MLFIECAIKFGSQKNDTRIDMQSCLTRRSTFYRGREKVKKITAGMN